MWRIALFQLVFTHVCSRDLQSVWHWGNCTRNSNSLCLCGSHHMLASSTHRPNLCAPLQESRDALEHGSAQPGIQCSQCFGSSNDQQVDKRLGFKVSCRIWWSLFNHHVPPWLALRSGTGGPCSPHCPAGNARRVSFSTSVGIIRGLEKSHCEQVMCMFITYWFSCVPALRQSCTTASYHCISNWENWGQNWKRFSRSSVLNVHRRLPNSMRAVKHISVSGWRNGADCGPISKAASPRDSCERCPAWRNSELSPACLISWSWSWIVCFF